MVLPKDARIKEKNGYPSACHRHKILSMAVILITWSSLKSDLKFRTQLSFYVLGNKKKKNSRSTGMEWKKEKEIDQTHIQGIRTLG
jgi:hypothetical protein